MRESPASPSIFYVRVMKTVRSIKVTIPLSLSILLLSACAPGKPKAVFPSMSVNFGKVIQGSSVEPEFVVKNDGSAALQIQKVNMTGPIKIVVTKMPSHIAPGAEGIIRLKLDTSKINGEIDGEISVSLNDPSLPEAQLELRGQVVGPIELSPMPAFFVAAQRGENKSSSIEIINHEPEPIRIEKIEHASTRFTTGLETIKEGQHYRLNLTLDSNAAAGRQADTILLKTSSKSTPQLKVVANTYLHERVYAFPDAVDFGKFSLDQVRQNPNLLQQIAQQFMVYQKGGSDFRVEVSTDLPNLNLKAVRGAAGDRYQVVVNLIREKLQPGPIKGSIFIHTTDREFPKITVPVSGLILEH